MYKFYKFYIKNSKFYNKFYTSSTSSTIIGIASMIVNTMVARGLWGRKCVRMV